MRLPIAVLHEILRQGKQDLGLAGHTATHDFQILCAGNLMGRGKTLARVTSVREVCQAVLRHMVRAVPSRLAAFAVPASGDERLSIVATEGYPLALVINGRNAMPAFGDLLTDQQVAAVVNYVRTHFGNQFADEVTAADAKAARP